MHGYMHIMFILYVHCPPCTQNNVIMQFSKTLFIIFVPQCRFILYALLVGSFLFPSDYVKHITRATMNWSRICLVVHPKVVGPKRRHRKCLCKSFGTYNIHPTYTHTHTCSSSILLLTHDSQNIIYVCACGVCTCTHIYFIIVKMSIKMRGKRRRWRRNTTQFDSNIIICHPKTCCLCICKSFGLCWFVKFYVVNGTGIIIQRYVVFK